MADDSQLSSGNALKLLLAWTFVGIPLVWGVVQTLLNAIKAFRKQRPATPPRPRDPRAGWC